MNPRAALLPLLLAACVTTSPASRLERMYTELHLEITGRRIGQGEDVTGWKRQEDRLEKVREIVAKNELATAADHFHASVLLVETNKEADLVSAHELALRAAEFGDDRGLRVAAEAQDKLCVKRRVAQRYGTQFVWEPVVKGWRLYPVDPSTTDAIRAAMGVESMEKLLQREAELNRVTGSKPN